MNFDQEEQTLPQAAQSRDVQGALQRLLLSKIHTPAQQQQLAEQRASALGQYQESLRAPVMGNYTPVDHSLNAWVGNIGSMAPFTALARGVSAGGDMQAKQNQLQHTSNALADKVGYEDAKDQDRLDTAELSAVKALANPKLTVQGMEKILPLYGRLFNSYSQQAKDIQFETPEERRIWIKENTDAAVSSAVEQFGGSVSPEVLDRLHGMAVAQSGGGTGGSVRPGPSKPMFEAGPNTIGPVSGPGTTNINESLGSMLSPADKATAAKLIDEINNPTSASRATAENELKRLISRYQTTNSTASAPGTPTGVNRSQFSQNTPPGSLPFINKPNDAMMKSGAQGMGAEYAKDYAAMGEVAAAAKEQFDAYSNLEKVDPNTNAFANAQGYVGMALQGLGLDPNTPLIQDAIKNRQANVLISQMKNAALRGEKGVQTRSDEVRVGDELAKTTDPKQAWTMLIQLGKERAARRMDMFEYAGGIAEKNNGVPIMARQKFISETQNDPLTQKIGTKLVFRTQFINDFLALNKGATQADAVQVWRGLEQEFLAGKRR